MFTMTVIEKNGWGNVWKSLSSFWTAWPPILPKQCGRSIVTDPQSEPLAVSPRMSDGGLLPWSARWKNTGFSEVFCTNLDYPEKGGALQWDQHAKKLVFPFQDCMPKGAHAPNLTHHDFRNLYHPPPPHLTLFARCLLQLLQYVQQLPAASLVPTMTSTNHLLKQKKENKKTGGISLSIHFDLF